MRALRQGPSVPPLPVSDLGHNEFSKGLLHRLLLYLSLGRSKTLEFVTGQIRQPTALLGEKIDAFSHFLSPNDSAIVCQLTYSLHSYHSKIAGNEFKCFRPPKG